MIFEHVVKFYKVNDDASITVSVGDKYYRCKARFDLAIAMKERKEGEEIVGKFGLAYVRGQGLVIQLIEVL